MSGGWLGQYLVLTREEGYADPSVDSWYSNAAPAEARAVDICRDTEEPAWVVYVVAEARSDGVTPSRASDKSAPAKKTRSR